MEGRRQLFVVMSEKHRYLIYGIKDPQRSGSRHEVNNINNLNEPLCRVDKSIYPSAMSFTAIGSWIFMVGGFEKDDRGGHFSSRKIFVYDTLSSTILEGPSLNSAKYHPIVFTLGSKVFAMSNKIYCHNRINETLDLEPRFEMLDTSENPSEWKWSVCRVPRLRVITRQNDYSVDAYAAVFIDGDFRNGVIFISVSEGGTYAYIISKDKWKHISEDQLPFDGHAITITHHPSLCCGFLLKSERFSAFRFSYPSRSSFQIEEIEIGENINYSLFPPLHGLRRVLRVCGPNGRFYTILSGGAEDDNSAAGVCYVQIYASTFSFLEPNLSEGPSLRRCRPPLRKCGTSLADDGKELNMTSIWSRSFYGGRTFDRLTHVAAAFAM